MHIGLLGFGVVGAGVYDWTRGRADLTVDRVLVRSSKPGIETISTHSIEDILNDPRHRHGRRGHGRAAPGL